MISRDDNDREEEEEEIACVQRCWREEREKRPQEVSLQLPSTMDVLIVYTISSIFQSHLVQNISSVSIEHDKWLYVLLNYIHLQSISNMSLLRAADAAEAEVTQECRQMADYILQQG